MPEGKDAMPPGVLSPDQKAALGTVAEKASERRNEGAQGSTSVDVPKTEPTKIGRRGFLGLFAGAAAVLGLGAKVGYDSASSNSAPATPEVSPTHVPLPDGDNFNGTPQNILDSYGHVPSTDATAESNAGHEPGATPDAAPGNNPLPAKIDGNKRGPEGEDILPMMKPTNPNVTARVDTNSITDGPLPLPPSNDPEALPMMPANRNNEVAMADPTKGGPLPEKPVETPLPLMPKRDDGTFVA